MTYTKKLHGYTTQARWFHLNIVGWDDESVVENGWTKLANGAVKPVHEMTDGTLVVILNGKTHLDRVIVEVPEGLTFATEDAARAQVTGW